jgi:hypothetical protein
MSSWRRPSSGGPGLPADDGLQAASQVIHAGTVFGQRAVPLPDAVHSITRNGELTTGFASGRSVPSAFHQALVFKVPQAPVEAGKVRRSLLENAQGLQTPGDLVPVLRLVRDAVENGRPQKPVECGPTAWTARLNHTGHPPILDMHK